jgi:hypothetical protein
MHGELMRVVNGHLCAVIPPPLIDGILRSLHDQVGHFGWKKTRDRAAECVWWPTWIRDTKRWVRECPRCHIKNAAVALQPPLHPIVAERIGQFVGVDVAGPLHVTPRGVRSVILAVDYFAKWPEATAYPVVEAADVCTFFRGWIARFGVHETIIADRGSVFDSDQFHEFCELRGINLHLTVAYHHQANGQAERTIRTLK